MRIGIDYHVLHQDWKGSGIQRYINSLYRSVMALPNHHEWLFFVGDPSRVPGDWPGRPQWCDQGTSSRLARLGWNTARRLREERIDCYHSQFVTPFQRTAKEFVTIHDLLFETHPQFFPWTTPYTLAPLIRRSARRASVILTISEYSRNQLLERYRVDPERIILTPNAVDPAMFHPGDPAESRRKVKEAYQVEDFILSVGRIEPRKNHLALVESYAYLKARGQDLPRMVFVGGKDFGFEDLVRTIHARGLEKDILFLHSVADDMLPHLYRAALLMAYPSFAEGFGIPPLEAMASGCPVVTSATTALGEVVGDAAWLVDPEQWPTVAQALLEGIQDGAQRRAFREKGLARAGVYSWENSARALLAAYDRVEALGG